MVKVLLLLKARVLLPKTLSIAQRSIKLFSSMNMDSNSRK